LYFSSLSLHDALPISDIRHCLVNTLRFPRVTREPPRTYRSLVSHFGHYSRRSLRVLPSLFCGLQLHHIYLLLDYIKLSLSTFVTVDWSGGQATPAGKATSLFGGTSKRSPS